MVGPWSIIIPKGFLGTVMKKELEHSISLFACDSWRPRVDHFHFLWHAFIDENDILHCDGMLGMWSSLGQ